MLFSKMIWSMCASQATGSGVVGVYRVEKNIYFPQVERGLIFPKHIGYSGEVNKLSAVTGVFRTVLVTLSVSQLSKEVAALR